MVSQSTDHVVEFFKRDESSMVTQLVLVDRFRKFRDLGIGLADGGAELASFRTTRPLRTRGAAVDECG